MRFPRTISTRTTPDTKLSDIVTADMLSGIQASVREARNATSPDWRVYGTSR